MESPKGYGAEYPNLLRNYRTIPRNQDGKLDLTPYQAAEKFNEALSTFDAYVAVAPFGSRVRGYSVPGFSEGSSDIDLMVFYDESLESDDQNLDLETFAELAGKKIKIINKTKGGVKVEEDIGHKVRYEFVMMGPAAIQRAVFALSRDGILEKFLGYLCSDTAIGPRLDEYRARVAEEIRKYPREKWDGMLNLIADPIPHADGMYIPRAQKRIEGFTANPEEAASIGESREQLWREQVRQSLGFDSDI